MAIGSQAQGTDDTLAATGGGPRGAEPEPARGELIGRYVILDRLGAGGMGVVFRAYDPKLDRKVAIKILHAPAVTSSAAEVDRARLLREGQAMARLSDPNVVTVFDVGEYGERAYVAMELVDGETLSAWSRRVPRSWREVLGVFLAAGRGLSAAHAKGLVHRDFKPENVMIDREGRVRVMDFGLARTGASESASARDETIEMPEIAEGTLEGVLAGTPAYMAPEQLALRTIGPAADQFAFCVALWETLYGRRPFAGESLGVLAFNVTRGTIEPPPRERRVPAWLRRILLRGLAVEPSDRWVSMDALVAAIDAAVRRRRRMLVLAVVAAVGLVLVGMRLASLIAVRAEHARCREGADAIAMEWNDEVRSELRHALVDPNRATTQATFDRAAALVDAHVAQWRETWTASCVAGVEQAAATWPTARTCLEDRRVELGAMLEVLREREPGTALQHVARMVLGLETTAQCGDATWLSQHPDGGRVDVELSRELWQAKALDAVGEVDATLELSLRIAERARARGDVRAHVRAMLLAARAEVDSGAHEAARARLFDAFDAANAAGADEEAIAVVAALVSLVGSHLSRDEEAQWWARLGLGLLARTGAQETLRASAMHNSIGLVHRAHGRFEAAEQSFSHSLAIKEKLLGPVHPDIAVAHDNLGLALRGQGRFAEAVEAHRLSLSIREETLGPDHVDTALASNNLGTVLDDVGRPDEARKALERALSIREAVYGPEHPIVAGSVLNLGLLAHDRGDHAAAEAYLQRASKIASSQPTPDRVGMARALNNLGLVYRASGRQQQALDAFERVVEIREELFAPDHPEIGAAYSNVALLHFELGDLDRAERVYEKARAILEQSNDGTLSITLANLGNLYARRGRLDAARDAFERALKVVEATSGPDTAETSLPHLGLAQVARAQSRFPDALRHAERALKVRIDQKLDPILVAEARFELAQAKLGAGNAKAEALELARDADAVLKTAAGDAYPGLRAEVHAWLQVHEGGAAAP
jgi:tetratricopeptide (TPR) repeat protein